MQMRRKKITMKKTSTSILASKTMRKIWPTWEDGQVAGTNQHLRRTGMRTD
jgi:hypothetical protein